MGSGPSTHLASIRNPCTLLLMSPYKSIKDVAKTLLGKANFLSKVVIERFRNVDTIQLVKCPVFFLHGLKDTLIPIAHTEELNMNCNSPSYMHIPEEMDHNTFDSEEDLFKPFEKFMKTIVEDRADKHPDELIPFVIFFEEKFYKPPAISLKLEA